jgi:hypothetical protein
MGLQIAKMKHRFPGFEYVRCDKAWYGHLQPTDESPRYRVKLVYAPKLVPKVWVLRPELHPDACQLHRYSDGSLCLYYPWDGDWRPELFVADTILPWAAEWLFCYECWLLDPEHRWPGPEAPHTGKK